MFEKRKKRLNQIKVLLLLLTCLVGIGSGLWLQTTLFILVVWVLYEVLWSDHIFYNPKSDYQYELDSDFQQEVNLEAGIILSNSLLSENPPDTWFLELPVSASTIAGRIFDPYFVLQSGEKQHTQYLERGAKGRRYIDLSNFSDELIKKKTVRIIGVHCSPGASGTLHGFNNPDYKKQRVLIIAPHADDAELAAFGLYNQAQDVHIVTLTAGEVEMDNYLHIASTPEAASVLKGQLRAMDSIAIPLWGGIPQERCIQLGYFCKRLKAMHEQPNTEFTSLTAGITDTRIFRKFNSRKLASDVNGKSTWNTLIQDLVELLDDIQPEVIITANPDIDPHEDHIYGTFAIREAIKKSTASPKYELQYANHYRTTDMFPFGPPHTVASLPPEFSGNKIRVYSCWSDIELQQKKVLSLKMMHDLQDKYILKKQLRRYLSESLIGRRLNRYGTEPYLHKAVKHNEVFIVSEAH